MNSYKQAWMDNVQSFSNFYNVSRHVTTNMAKGKVRRPHGSLKHTVTHSMIDHAVESATNAAITYAAPKILRHLAQNQIKGKIVIIGRVGGRAGLRFVPVLGTAMMIKDAYSVYRWMTD